MKQSSGNEFLLSLLSILYLRQAKRPSTVKRGTSVRFFIVNNKSVELA